MKLGYRNQFLIFWNCLPKKFLLLIPPVIITVCPISTTFKTTTEEPDVMFNIKYQLSFSMVNEGNVKVEYSFNGNTLHGDMTPGTSTSSITFDNRKVSKIWFRVPDGGSAIVRVEAWSQ